MKKDGTKKKVAETKEKKSIKDKILIFAHGVKGEFDKVHWTSKSNMVKYSIATIVFIIFCALFFYAIDIIFAFVRSLFG